jgi:hypothetical protein
MALTNESNLEWNSILMVYLLGCSGLIFGGYNIYSVMRIKLNIIKSKKKEEEDADEKAVLNLEKQEVELKQAEIEKLESTAKLISDGANVFLFWEYLYLLFFVVGFAIIIFFVSEHRLWTAYVTCAFILGALTSMLCGWIGMWIATRTNYKTCYSA